MRKHFLPLILSILLLLTAAVPVFAAETGSVTVLFRHEGQPVAAASFSIYKAAEWNGSGYTLTGPFSDYPVKMTEDPDSEEWKAIASTLAAYAARDEIAPLSSEQTGTDGTLCFEGLAEGLYLLVGEEAASDDERLFPQPMLAAVPYATENGGESYAVVTTPKYEVRNPEEKTVTRRALKIWKDEGNEEKRPQDVTVQLLCDGEVYEEQVLNAANHWAYTWENLDAAHDWQLTEKEVPEGYTVQITRQETTFTVTNTRTTDTPEETDTPGTTENPGTTDTPGTTNTPETTNTPATEEPVLPQTGMLWWPVPVLAGIGAVSLFFGIFLLLRKKDDQNA